MIRETITFTFEDTEQQRRFHERLEGSEGFASQVWGLSLLAQAELENGDVDGVQKTLVRIAEAAAAVPSSQQPQTSQG